MGTDQVVAVSCHFHGNKRRNSFRAIVTKSLGQGTEAYSLVFSFLFLVNKLGREGNFINLIKSIYEKLTANIIVNGKKLQAFALRPGTRQACLLLPLLSNSTGDSRQVNKDRKRNKRHQIGKEEVKLSLFADDVIF